MEKWGRIPTLIEKSAGVWLGDILKSKYSDTICFCPNLTSWILVLQSLFRYVMMHFLQNICWHLGSITFLSESLLRQITQSVCVRILTELHFLHELVLAFPSHPDNFTTFEEDALGNDCFVGPIMIFENSSNSTDDFFVTKPAYKWKPPRQAQWRI